MRRHLVAALAICAAAACTAEKAVTKPDEAQRQEPVAAKPKPPRFQVPVEYHKLDNGLRVVLSPDPSVPRVSIGVYYNIGFRLEPKDRTGFAHLFEHMMFQGSENLGKMAFIRLVESNGGTLNGSTRFDFTNYIEVVPPHALEPLLWAEADRMKGLAVTQDNLANQQGVVKNEVKVNVLNQPYGGFPWLDVPQVANTNWYNAHNFYGDLKDLDAATLADVQSFFKTYYAPNNAAIAIAGNIDPAQTLAWVKKYFGAIPAAPQPQKPDLTEPRQEQEKRAEKVDPLAPRPALAVAYHVPPRNTPEHLAMGILHELLVNGKDSRFYQGLVQQKQLTGDVYGGINLLGNMFDYSGPMTWTVFTFHDNDKTPDQLIAAMDEEIQKLQRAPIDAQTLALARVKFRSSLYGMYEDFYSLGLVDLLACFALFDDDPSRVNRIEDELDQVTPALIQKVALEYLRPTNRTVLAVKPKS